MLYGEMKFPEFMFKPSQLTQNVSLNCDTTASAGALGYTVLRRSVCVPCLTGTFFNQYTNYCTRCPVNTYQDQLAARSCTRCRRNHYTKHVGTLCQLYTYLFVELPSVALLLKCILFIILYSDVQSFMLYIQFSLLFFCDI